MRVLVTGSGGQVGGDVVLALRGDVPPGGTRASLWGTAPSGLEVVGADHRTLPVDDRTAVLAAAEGLRPEVIVHCGAFTAVDACEDDPQRAFKVNALGTRHLVEAAQRVGAHFVYLSTDYVFDGRSHRPYLEWDATHPLSVYGHSKLGGEWECPPSATVVRTSWVCGAAGSNVVRTALGLASGGEALHFVDAQHGSPPVSADLAAAVVTLALERRPGVFHVTNQGATTWFGLVRAVLGAAGSDPGRVQPIATAELHPPRRAVRPANSVLDNAALRLSGLPLLPPWQEGLDRLVAALAPVGAP